MFHDCSFPELTARKLSNCAYPRRPTAPLAACFREASPKKSSFAFPFPIIRSYGFCSRDLSQPEVLSPLLRDAHAYGEVLGEASLRVFEAENPCNTFLNLTCCAVVKEK